MDGKPKKKILWKNSRCRNGIRIKLIDFRDFHLHEFQFSYYYSTSTFFLFLALTILFTLHEGGYSCSLAAVESHGKGLTENQLALRYFVVNKSVFRFVKKSIPSANWVKWILLMQKKKLICGIVISKVKLRIDWLGVSSFEWEKKKWLISKKLSGNKEKRL